MNVLGIRCSNKDFTYVVMTGSKKAPKLVQCETISIPKNYSKPRGLQWFVQEVGQLIQRHQVKKVAIKGFEGKFRGKTYEERVELETAVYIAGVNNGINAIFKKVKSTIAKDLGLKGKGHYLETRLDTSYVADYGKRSDKEKDAVLAAWSELA